MPDHSTKIMITTVVLPCYNPQPGWEKNISLFYDSFRSQINGEVELILVMDGDGPWFNETISSYLLQHIPGIIIVSYPQNRGKGFAIRQGVAKASGNIIIYTDVDFPYTMESMCMIHQELANGHAEVAIGIKDGHYYSHLTPMRRFISKFLQALIRLCVRIPISDTQCGLKGFSLSVATVFMRTSVDRYLFDLEFVKLCYREKQLKVKPIPVTLNENVHFRKMNYRILLPEMMNFAKLLFKAR